MRLTGLIRPVRDAPYVLPVVGVLALAAYLCLVNLNYAALWHDEAPAAVIGRNLLQRGDISGWDGRNLVGGTNGRTLNDDLRDVLPPLTYVFTAAGTAVFGVNEGGARVVPALIGILSLGFLYLLLHQHLADYPRLIVRRTVVHCRDATKIDDAQRPPGNDPREVTHCGKLAGKCR